MPLLVVHSPKGGVGCTTVAANLAAWLSRGGRRVVVADFGAHESIALHLERSAGLAAPDLPDHATDYAPGGEYLERVSGIEILSRSSELTGEQLIARIDAMLDGRDDALIIADIPSGDEATLAALAGRCLIRLCVLGADAGSAAMLPMLLRGPPVAPDAARIHYVLNMLDERRSVGRELHRLLGAAAGEDLVAVIRRDEAVNEALAMLVPIFDHAPASAAAQDLAGLADRIAASIDVQQTHVQEAAA
jgi:chromosome partitioning protein